MKHLFFLAIAGFLSLTISAQPGGGGGGFQRQTPEQRVAAIHAKLDSAFKLDASTFAALDTALVTLYRQQDAKMKEMMAGGRDNIDRDAMQAERKKYTDAQEEILKAVLNQEQYEIWKEKIAPSMRQPRQQGGGRPQGGGNN